MPHPFKKEWTAALKAGTAVVVGIDPGVRTGVSFYYPGEHRVHSFTADILEAMDAVAKEHKQMTIFVNIENPNLRRWYGQTSREVLQGAGSIKRDYSVWVSFLEREGIPFAEIAPKDVGQLTPALARKLTAKKRTSIHERDAICMALKKPLLL